MSLFVPTCKAFELGYVNSCFLGLIILRNRLEGGKTEVEGGATAQEVEEVQR